MVMVVVLDWDRADRGQYQLKGELVAPDGRVVLTVDGHSDVKPMPPGHPPARTRIVMNVENAVFPSPGRYHLRFIVKGRRFRGPSLHLVELETPEETSGDTGTELETPGKALETPGEGDHGS
jgi:hypothetical protein